MKRFINAKTISIFDFEKLLNYEVIDKGTLDLELKGYSASAKNILDALLALLGSDFPLVTKDDQICPEETLKKWTLESQQGRIFYKDGNAISTKKLVGILKLLTAPTRSNILGRMTQGIDTRYAANVPLVLSAFKQYRDVEYSKWNWSNPFMRYFVDDSMLAMSEWFNASISWSTKELLEFRKVMCTKKDIVLAPTKVYSAKETGLDEAFDALPKLVKMCLTQMWVFHPSICHKYGINNLNDIDKPGVPLLSSDIPAKGVDHWDALISSIPNTPEPSSWKDVWK